MKAIQISAPGKVEIIQMQKPAPKEGEALLRLLYGGICGSDLRSFMGTFAYFSYPRVPGHEFSAVIEEIGTKASGLKPGMIVTCNPYFNCGTCYACEHGLVNACMDNQTMGVQRSGAFSEYITMPIERIYDGKGLDPQLLAMIEPFCIGYHGVQQGNIKKGDRVLIIGAGTIGMMAAFSAKAQGADVYLTDIAPHKLAFAQKLGFSNVFSSEQFSENVKEITQGNGFDVCIEAVGLPCTFQNCIDAVCFGGRVVLIGVGKQNLDFNFTQIQKKEIHIAGSRNALKEDFLSLIDLVKTGSVPLQEMITAVYPYEKAQEAFGEYADHAGDVMKILLDFTRKG